MGNIALGGMSGIRGGSMIRDKRDAAFESRMGRGYSGCQVSRIR